MTFASTYIFLHINIQKIYVLNFTGKRLELYPIEAVVLEKEQNSKLHREGNPQERRKAHKRCMTLFCPFVRCPLGQHLAKGYDGCRTCRCVERQNTGKFNTTCND